MRHWTLASRVGSFGILESLVFSVSIARQGTCAGTRSRGPRPDCRPCKARAACLNQALGQRDRIKRVRDVTHPCLLNEERARVVEVELAPPEASLPSRAAIEGAVLSYEKIVCSNAACPN